jgi:Ca-activated chloride channel family protein
MEVSDLYPKRIPDVFVGRPVLITGHYDGDVPPKVVVTGRAGSEDRTYVVSVAGDAAEAEHPGIESVWARCRIADLSDQETYAPSSRLRAEITDTSLTYRLLSQYTAFVATDESRVTEGDYGVTVGVPVPVPEGVSYRTNVQES